MNQPHSSSLRRPVRRIAARLLAALGASLLPACFAVVGGCAQPNPPTSAIVKPIELPVGSFMAKWRADLQFQQKDDVVTELYVRDELIFAYTKSHTVYAIDKETGTLRSVTQPTSAENHLFPPVVLKEFVVYPTILTLYVYDRKGHFLKAVRPRDIAIGTRAVGAGTRVFFGGDSVGGGRAVSMDLNGSQYQNASENWKLLTMGGLSGAPVFQQGFVYIGDRKGNVYAVNAESCAPIWPLESKDTGREDHVFGTDGAIEADMKADDFGVYVASLDSKFYCLDRISGRVKWQYYGDLPLRHSPDVSASTVYLFVDGRGLVAMDKQNTDPKQYNRTARWVMPDGRGVLGEDDKYTYVHRGDGAVVAVDKATGLPQYTTKKRYGVFGANAKGGVSFVATPDGHVFAATLNLKPGAPGEVALAK